MGEGGERDNAHEDIVLCFSEHKSILTGAERDELSRK